MSPRSVNARNAGLELISRVNRWLIAGAVALTGAISVAAAKSFHGHSSTSSPATSSQSSSPSSSSSSGGGNSASGSGSSGLAAPSQSPGATGASSAPVTVSGGS